MTTNSSPRIYVASLAAYNNGHLHGRWIDATLDADSIHEEVQAMLVDSPIPNAEEWAIHDYEGFAGYQVSEYDSFERVATIATFIEANTRFGGALLEHFCGDLEDATKALDNYAGEYRSLAEFAQELTEETSEIPEHLRYYIDYDAMARDMELNGDVFTIETGFEVVHVFWRH